MYGSISLHDSPFRGVSIPYGNHVLISVFMFFPKQKGGKLYHCLGVLSVF